MLQDVVNVGFGAWVAFSFSGQIRSMNLENKLWKQRRKNVNPVNRTLFVMTRLLTMVVMYLGIFGIASIYGGYKEIHNMDDLGLGFVIGIVLFLFGRYSSSNVFPNSESELR